jgi:hypothetical protein
MSQPLGYYYKYIHNAAGCILHFYFINCQNSKKLDLESPNFIFFKINKYLTKKCEFSVVGIMVFSNHLLLLARLCMILCPHANFP